MPNGTATPIGASVSPLGYRLPSLSNMIEATACPYGSDEIGDRFIIYVQPYLTVDGQVPYFRLTLTALDSTVNAGISCSSVSLKLYCSQTKLRRVPVILTAFTE